MVGGLEATSINAPADGEGIGTGSNGDDDYRNRSNGGDDNGNGNGNEDVDTGGGARGDETGALLSTSDDEPDMEPEAVESLIESELEDADVTVGRARGDHDDDHLAATVVSPAFEGLPLVQQHQRVYDALEGHMTTDIHALELSTYTPAEYAERVDD